MTSSLANKSIISKLSLSQKKIPLPNAFFHKASQEIFQTSIHNFVLAIYLWMVKRVEPKCSSKLPPKSTPKMTYKLKW